MPEPLFTGVHLADPAVMPRPQLSARSDRVRINGSLQLFAVSDAPVGVSRECRFATASSGAR
jgi:hypothetical protein